MADRAIVFERRKDHGRVPRDEIEPVRLTELAFSTQEVAS